MLRTLRFLFLIFALLLGAGVHAGEGLQRLDRFYNQVHSFQADFHQVLRDAKGNVLQESNGVMMLQRPDRFRWTYDEPYPQLVVGDGKRIWFYDKELEQVSVKSMEKTIGNTPALMLSGNRPLTSEFDITGEGRREGRVWVVLEPRQADSNFQAVHVGFGDELEMMVLEDQFDQTTRIEFTNVQRNPDLDPQLFTFVVPEGVDVVGERF